MKLFRDYAVLAVGQIAGKLAGFLAFAWLARALDPEGYGAVEYLVGLAVLFAALVDGGLGVVGVRRAARDPSALARLAFQIPIARWVLAAVGVPIMAMIALTTMKSAAPSGLAWLFALSLLAIPWRQEWLLQATERMADLAIAQLLRMCVFVAGVWAIVRGPQDVMAVGWAEIGAVAAMTAYCIYVQQTRITPFRLGGSTHGVPAMVIEGSAVGASNVVWTLNQYAPLFLLASLQGGAQLAWFAAAARVVGSLLIFSNVYHFNLYPAVARATKRQDRELAQLLAASCRVTAWGGIFAALVLTLLAEPLMIVAMGPKMASAAPLLQVMAWMLPVALCSGHARWSLAAAGAQTRVLWAQLAGLMTTVVVVLLLSPLAAGLGYALAALAGFVTVWAVVHVFAARRGLYPPPFHLSLKPALLAGAIVAASQALPSGPWLSLAGLALYLAVAPLLDRKLFADFSTLGRAKLGTGDVRRS